MKKLYWRPQRISLRLLWLVALVSVGGLILVETYRVKEKQPFYAEKIQAARLTLRAFNVIKTERLKRGIPVNPEADPAQTGIIGDLLTEVTTNPGHLPSKQTSANPNFAAVMVHLLKRAGVQEGDMVAVGLSGSFPALNIATLAAINAIKARPLIISGAGSSQWGANHEDFMWPDMEKVLYDQRVLPYRSLAVSKGGIDDRALGLSKRGRALLDVVLNRSGVPRLDVKDYGDSLQKRMDIYTEAAAGGEIKAYINVGGGTTSVGTKIGKTMFKPGLNRTVPKGASEIDSIMLRFATEGIPVIHITNIHEIAERYNLPLTPQRIPTAGQGSIFHKEVHNRALVTVMLMIIIALLVTFVRLDWGYRIMSGAKRERAATKPERMV